MLRIMAGLSLAAILTASAVPAVANGSDFGERFFALNSDGSPSFVEPLEDWFLGEALEGMLHSFGEAVGEDVASEEANGDSVANEEITDENVASEEANGGNTANEEATDEDVASEGANGERASTEAFCDLFGGVFSDFCEDDNGSEKELATPRSVQTIDQEAESGEVSQGISVSNQGDYASQCTPALQFANTGNFQNAPGFVQDRGEANDFEPGGIEFTAAPELGVRCNQQVQQSSAASG